MLNPGLSNKYWRIVMLNLFQHLHHILKRFRIKFGMTLNFFIPNLVLSLLRQLLQSRQYLHLCIIVNPLKKRQLKSAFFRIFLTLRTRSYFIGAAVGRCTSYANYYTKPCAIIASATFTKPAILAPA